jgi:hypothetical protein
LALQEGMITAGRAQLPTQGARLEQIAMQRQRLGANPAPDSRSTDANRKEVMTSAVFSPVAPLIWKVNGYLHLEHCPHLIVFPQVARTKTARDLSVANPCLFLQF